MHADGRLQEAEDLYRRILLDCPGQPGANHNLGVMSAQRGWPQQALPYLRTAVREAPGIAQFRLSHILALLDCGLPTAAGRALRQCRRLGFSGAAFDDLQRRLDETGRRAPPAEGGALFDLAFDHHRAGRLGSAAAGYRQALRHRPDDPRPLYWLGNALRDQGWLEPAAACYRRLLIDRPDVAEALFVIASFDDDRRGFARVLALKADYAAVYCNLGAMAAASEQTRRAMALWRAALALDPLLAEAWFNLGTVYDGLGENEIAILRYRRARTILPGYAGAHVNEALCRLRLGDYAGGWAEYEWRWHGGSRDQAPRAFAVPRWDGGALPGRTILLHAEQGFGDALQFCRYLPMAAMASRARLVLEVQPPLKTLLADLPGAAQVIAQGEPLPPFDAHCPLLSLPGIFGTTAKTIPERLRQLAAAPARVRQWQRRFTPGRPQIGLCWAGNPGNRTDRRRSLPLEQLLPLLVRGGATWHVLQKDLRQGDDRLIAAVPALVRHRLADFADSAALVSALDLVVSVDTAVAHLAGTLGRPTWLLLPYVADWRWLQDGEVSPWYPSMRLFRQSAPGDWGSVLDRLAEALDDIAPVPRRRREDSGHLRPLCDTLATKLSI